MKKYLIIFISVIAILALSLIGVWYLKSNADSKVKNSANQNGGEVNTGQQTLDAQYLNIKELGIKIPKPLELEDLSYKYEPANKNNNNMEYVYFDSQKLHAQMAKMKGYSAPDCGQSYTNLLGWIQRFKTFPSYPEMQEGPYVTPSEDSIYFNGSYFEFYSPQDGCSESEEINKAAYNAFLKVQESFKKSVAADTNVLLSKSPIGIIEGSLSYPSEGIPDDIKTCAQNIDTKKYYCMPGSFIDKKYKYENGYLIYVPAGKYNVFSSVSSNPTSNNTFRAYYNNYVKCGLKAGCKDHKLITVVVETGKTVSGIDPSDWDDRSQSKELR